MRIDHSGICYEGIPAANAIGMALFETSGMRELIDRRCKYDPGRRNLSPGMVVKAIIGPTFNVSKKYPLYLTETAYRSTPTDLLFGSGVTKDDLYDTALARGLDTLFDADLTSLFTECAGLAARTFGFESNVFHMDSTDISFSGISHEPDKPGAAVPKHNGHAKDHRNQLLQYEMQIVTDSNRIIRYMKPYSGNVCDSVMDSETLDDLARIFDREFLSDTIMVGDCKLATAGNIAKMIDMGMFFVSKCSDTFVGNARRAVAAWAASAETAEIRPGLRSAGTFRTVELRKGREETLRFVAFRWDGKVDAAVERIRQRAPRDAESVVTRFKGVRFRKRSDALKAFEKLGLDPEGPVRFGVDAVFYGSDHPEDVPDWWELRLEPEISEEGILREARMSETVVLVTNLPEPPGDGTARPGPAASDAGVMDYYNQEYKVEQSFRLMKSGMGMNSIFLQTPSRENAMMFAVSIAVLISNIADAMFRRKTVLLKGRQLTMYRLAYEVQTTIVIYSRSENSLSLMGPDEVTKMFFDYTDALRINPRHLLTYKSG